MKTEQEIRDELKEWEETLTLTTELYTNKPNPMDLLMSRFAAGYVQALKNVLEESED